MPLQIAIAPVDLLVLFTYLAGVVLFGLWVGRGQRDVTGYLLGGRDLPWWAILGSIVATETSTATFLSVPGLAFASKAAGAEYLDPAIGGDMRFLQLALGFMLGRCVIIYLLLPLFFRGQLFTAYQVLHERFGGATKNAASLIFLLARNISDGLRLFLTAIVLEAVTNIPLAICVVIVGLLTIVYTFFGGIKSVVWNDCVQFVVYVGGGILVLLIILHRLPGGWEQFTAFAQSAGKFRVFDVSFEPSTRFTLWAGLVGGAILSLGTHGTDQMMVQRYLCARSRSQAARAIVGSGIVVLLQFTLFLTLGAALASYYVEFPPATPFDKSDKVFATFIVQELPAGIGLVGIILAAVFSAAMSTLSSSLNSSASSALNDLYVPYCSSRPAESHLLRISRALTVFFGLLQIGIGIAGMYLVTAVVDNVLAVAGFTSGLLLGVFALGALTRGVGQRGAFVGLITGLVVLVGVKFFSEIAWTWYAAIGAVTTYGVGFLASQVFTEKSA
jgi:SSS family transporter